MACCCSTSRWACPATHALQKAKWLLRAEKAGHTGTLDPLATGVLPLCFGAATKFASCSLDADKTYARDAAARRDDDDRRRRRRGDRRARRSTSTREQTRARLRAVHRPDRQVPPMHSALKNDGKALYEYARAGIEVERAPRAGDDPRDRRRRRRRRPLDASTSRCSKGTYIRTLAKTSARRWAAARTWRRCAAPAAARFDVAAVRHARRARSAWTRPSATRACCRPTRCSPTGRASSRSDAKMRAASWPACAAACRWPDARRGRASTAPSRGAFLGTGHVAAGELIPTRLAEPHRSPATSSRTHALTEADTMHDPPDPQHRHHRPRRPWQDHAGRPAAAPDRHLPRATRRSPTRVMDNNDLERSAASRSWPRTAPSSGRARTSTSSTRPATPTSAARSSARCRWSTACCC